jgi:hypothetical protein
MRKHGLALLLMAVALAAFGCAQPQGGADKLVIIKDPEQMLSRSRWEVLELPGEASVLASVTDSTGDILLALSCDDDDSLGLLIGRREGSQLQNPSLALTWDGEDEVERRWNAVPDEEVWAFGVLEDHSAFWPSITRLRQHRSLEAVVSAADQPEQRYRFSLAQAAGAIDYVLAKCGKKAPA